MSRASLCTTSPASCFAEGDAAALEDADGSTELTQPDAAASVLSNDPFEASCSL